MISIPIMLAFGFMTNVKDILVVRELQVDTYSYCRLLRFAGNWMRKKEFGMRQKVMNLLVTQEGDQLAFLSQMTLL